MLRHANNRAASSKLVGYLLRFRLGAAVLLARRPTLALPFAFAWSVSLVRAAFYQFDREPHAACPLRDPPPLQGS